MSGCASSIVSGLVRERATVKELLEIAPKLLATATLVITGLAITHEWFYFGVIGRQFQTLMSVQDYLSSALESLPLALSFRFIFVAFMAIVLRWLDFPKMEPGETWTMGDVVIAVALLLLSIVSFFLWHPVASATLYMISFWYWWFLLSHYVITHEKFVSSITAPMLFSVYL